MKVPSVPTPTPTYVNDEIVPIFLSFEDGFDKY